MPRPQDFAATLRWWRRRRGWSQLDLAERADISQRHLSFLELGRASPSRDMVVRLAAALDIPLRQKNTLLIAAGFAPIWRETALSAPELAQVRTALDYILGQQEPFPAVAVDRHWNMLTANGGMKRLVAFLVGPLPPDAKVNLADALVAPDVLRPFLVNWEVVVRYFIRSVEADASADGDPETGNLLERLLSHGDVRRVGLSREAMFSPATRISLNQVIECYRSASCAGIPSPASASITEAPQSQALSLHEAHGRARLDRTCVRIEISADRHVSR